MAPRTFIHNGAVSSVASNRLYQPSFKTVSRVFLVLIIACLSMAAMVYGKEQLSEMLLWLESHNNSGGMFLFVVAETCAVALLLPAVPLIIAAGLVFGFVRGVFCVWIAASIGQIVAFLLSRYVLRDCMVSIMQKRFPMWEALDKAIQADGWKLILMLRVSPLVPYNVMNVLLGSSGIKFSTFVFFSTIGIIPECMITVYFGTLAGNVANVINGRAGPQGAAKLGFLAIGGIMMMITAIYAAYVTRKAVKRAVSKADKHNFTTSNSSLPKLDRSDDIEEDIKPIAVLPTVYVDQQQDEHVTVPCDLASGLSTSGQLKPSRSSLLFAGITAGIPMVQSYEHVSKADVPPEEKNA